MIIYFRFSWFLFRIQILLIKQVISFFLDRDRWSNTKKAFSKIIWKFGFWVFIWCFSKNQAIVVKSDEEYNFKLFWHNIYAYSLKKIISSNFRSLIAIQRKIDQKDVIKYKNFIQDARKLPIYQGFVFHSFGLVAAPITTILDDSFK